MAGNTKTATAAAAIVDAPSWDQALGAALGEVGDRLTTTPDLVFLFASPAYAQQFAQIAAVAQERTGARVLAGCSGQGIIGADREVEDRPALSMLAISLPGAALRAVHITQPFVEACATAEDWHRLTGVAPEAVNAWIIFSDPFTLNPERLLAGLSAAYPGTPLVGGVASGSPHVRRTHLFLNGDVHAAGAVLIALGGAYTVRTVVSQGAEPIGESWTVTSAQGNMLESIGGRPAHEVLIETFQSLPPAVQHRAQTNLLIGLAADEYRDRFRRGDFLIRNLIGVDRDTGALAISASPRVGQTVQFQIRDASAADEELRTMLSVTREELGATAPVAALLCACNGRGAGLFGAPDHDARALAEQLGPLPAAGLFCNGEIGPVGGVPFLHGFTASIGLIVPVARSP
ncbi:MAG: FIST signal transduction protein [Dehalococcoidia bacterium]